MNSKHIKRLVSLANLADEAGWHKEANLADGLVKQASQFCSDCHRSLHDSYEGKQGGVQYKTCTKCSEMAGMHVAYPFTPEYFGRYPSREKMPWCNECYYDGWKKGGGLAVYTPANIDCTELFGRDDYKTPSDKKPRDWKADKRHVELMLAHKLNKKRKDDGLNPLSFEEAVAELGPIPTKLILEMTQAKKPFGG